MNAELDSLFVHAARGGMAHAPAIDLSTTYRIDDLDDGAASLTEQADGGAPRGTPVYARLHNPTVRRFEEALAIAEKAEDAVAYASGMAAISALLMDAARRGGHVVAVRPLYGGTDHLLASGLLGLDVDFVAEGDVAASIRPETSLVFVETPANPTLQLVDIAGVVAAAGSVPVAVDNTFATPVLQNPIELGAAYVVHSATKFIGGHGDALGGVVATTEQRARSLRQLRIATGAVLHPIAGYLLHRGLQTLPIRVRAAQDNAQRIAERLVERRDVVRVGYPGFADAPNAHLVGTQMRGAGAVLAFEVDGGFDAARQLMRSVELIVPAVSLGSTDTLIEHPAGLTHQVVDADARERTGIVAGLVRLSVGIEDVDDLWDDLSAALDAAHRVAGRAFPDAPASRVVAHRAA